MYLNLTEMSDEEIKEKSEDFVKDLENGTCPVVTDQCDYYSGKIYESHENMTRLREKENSRMIDQNNRERVNEVGESCFDTALEGSKIFQKSMKK